MKKFILLLVIVFLFVSYSHASQVTLSWSDDNSKVDGYAIFQRSFQQSYALPIWEGIETTCTIAVPDDRETAYVCRAYIFGVMDIDGNMPKIWSGDSNEVVFTPQSPSPPEAPQNFILQLLQAILNWFSGLFG